jgi:threonine efflux protein
MQELATLASIVAALSIGVISPGPSFVMVARVAVASSRIRALATALGMGAGGAIFGAAALLGLQSVLLAVPALYAALKVLGGLYLCYLGFVIFRSAQQPLAPVADSGKGSGRPLHAFWLGLTTQLSNPKTAIVYASVFAAFLPASFSPRPSRWASPPRCLQRCFSSSPPGMYWSPFSFRRQGRNGLICRTRPGLIERPAPSCSVSA